jgi:hypothetical protein
MMEKSWKIEKLATLSFFVGGFLALIRDGPLFFAKISHYANIQRDRRRLGWKKAFFATIAVVWPI